MGKDKFENEDLIKWGLPHDLWFHVDGLSSAHVYLRLPSTDYNIDNIPKEVLEECLQLVKHNSIEGCKKNSVKVCYTPWANLEKTSSMEVGQVGHKNNKEIDPDEIFMDSRNLPQFDNQQFEGRIENFKLININMGIQKDSDEDRISKLD